jgi:hypothetical protein
MCLDSPTEAFKFTGLREEISSAAKVLVAASVRL